MKKTVSEELNATKSASLPCMLHELRADGTPVVDPEQARDAANWRKAERARLIKARCAFGAQYRADQVIIIARQLEQILATGRATGAAVSVYWPIRGEPDLRPWMHTLSQAGGRVALPVEALGLLLENQ